ncbi:MAG: bacteriohemerythrin [Spirochaetaceae bacterium]|jgi:methyl-accepting chemotaxis protein|nr:bacteriohemerythrin [Spirochaetaceae bacterium]
MKLSLRVSIFIGIVVLLVTASIGFLALNHASGVLVMGALALILLSVGAAFLFGWALAKPIVGVSSALKGIAMEEGDLTRRITIPIKRAHGSEDETAELTRYCNLAMEKICAFVLGIKRQTAMLDGIGGDLSVNMTQTAAVVQQITSNIRSINGQASSQNELLARNSATAGEMSCGLSALYAQIETQTASVEKSSSAVEEMLANIEEVTRTLVKNAENMSILADASEQGHSGLVQVVENIKDIAEESENLLQINTLMQSIASQTNLLSMNAAIEAAHAGEAGKGFAVVADEIRKLAESSSEQSKTISTTLKKIAASIQTIRSSTDNVREKFTAIENGVRTVAEEEERIRGAMEEQGEGSKQVMEAVSAVQEITLQVKTGAASMLDAGKRMSGECVNLESLSTEISNGMFEMEKGADQINTALSNVNTMSARNKENIAILVTEVTHFKTDEGVPEVKQAAASPEIFQYYWDDSFAVHYPLIDEQHKELFAKVNGLLAAIQQGKGQDELKKSLDFLNDYTIKHFFEEEEIQKKFKYPGHPAHHKLHEEFKALVRGFSHELIMKGATEELTEAVKKKIGGWLISHIKGEDVKIVAYIKEQA